MKKILAMVAAAGLVAVLLTACGGGKSADGQITIKFSHVVAPDAPKGKAAQKFKELVEEKTDGKVKVQVYPNGQLYGDNEEMEALQANNVQLISPSITKLVGFDPAFQIVDMPFLFRDSKHVQTFWNGKYGQELFDRLKKQNVQSLTVWENGFKQWVNSDKPLKKPEDFKGLKFRVQAGKVLEAQYKQLGAGAVAIPFNDTYTALQQGTVDGTENTFNNMETQKYQEVQKYMTVADFGRIDYVVLTNTEFWNSLPDDVKPKIEEAMKEATEYENSLADDLNQESYKKMKDAGVQVHVLTDAERKDFEKAFEPMYRNFEKVIGKEILEGARK